MAELRIESGILGFRCFSCCFLRRPVYGGFVYLSLPRWMLLVNGRPAERLLERPPEHHGTLRNGTMAELRIKSVILRIHGSAFSFSSLAAHLRRFRVYGIRDSSPKSRKRFPGIEAFRARTLWIFPDSKALWYPITAAKYLCFVEDMRDTLTPQ